MWTGPHSLGSRSRDGLLLGAARNDVNAVLRDDDEVLADLEKLLDQRRVLLLGAHKHLFLGGRVLANKGAALARVVEIVQQDGLVALVGNAGGVLQRLVIRDNDLGGGDGRRGSAGGGGRGRHF